MLTGFSNDTTAGESAFGDDLGGSAGGGGTDIGNEVADGEIDFVSDGRNDRDGGLINGASDDFFVEGPEILEAAAATGEENQIEPARRVGQHGTIAPG